MKTLDGSKIRLALSHYENVLLITHNHEQNYYITYDDITKMAQVFKHTIEKKKTRTWVKPIIHMPFDFAEFKEYLLYNEECSTEDMELIIRFLGDYLERKSKGEIFIEDEDIQS